MKKVGGAFTGEDLFDIIFDTASIEAPRLVGLLSSVLGGEVKDILLRSSTWKEE